MNPFSNPVSMASGSKSKNAAPKRVPAANAINKNIDFLRNLSFIPSVITPINDIKLIKITEIKMYKSSIDG